MGSTGVDTSIPESEAWTLRVFVHASQKVPGEMLETGSHWLSVGTQRLGGKQFFVLWLKLCLGF